MRTLPVELAVLFLDLNYLGLSCRSLLLKLDQFFILLLEQSGNVVDLLVQLQVQPLKLVLLVAIDLQLLAHLDKTLALLVVVLVLQGRQESISLIGAGFRLANMDLEIRGAGELLGDTQSGQIQEIGFRCTPNCLAVRSSLCRSARSRTSKPHSMPVLISTCTSRHCCPTTMCQTCI